MKKLAEILADIMEEWPSTTKYYTQDYDRTVYPWVTKPYLNEGFWEEESPLEDGIDRNWEALSYNTDLASDWDEALVTKEMWIAEKGRKDCVGTQSYTTGGGTSGHIHVESMNLCATEDTSVQDDAQEEREVEDCENYLAQRELLVRRRDMKLAEFLLSNVSEYNGHKQLEVNNTSLSTLKQILTELEKEDTKHMYAMKIYEDGSGFIEQLDYWDTGEHPSGHLDRTILSFTICDWCGE